MAQRNIRRDVKPTGPASPPVKPAAAANPGAGSLTSSPSPSPKPAPIADSHATDITLAKAVETQWKVYQANNEWIRFADLKAGALLTADGALLAAALSALKDNTRFLRVHPVVLDLTFVSGAALLVSVGYCLWCLSPKTARFHARHDHHPDSLIFFEHIAAIEKGDYLTKAKAMGSEAIAYQQIAQQVWINARVSQTKHRQITLAIRACAVSCGAALLAALVAWFR